MKTVILILLLTMFSFCCVLPSAAQSNAKSQTRELRKADKRRQKAMKKYAKEQKKAERKMLRTERKNTKYPKQTF